MTTKMNNTQIDNTLDHLFHARGLLIALALDDGLETIDDRFGNSLAEMNLFIAGKLL